MSSYTRSMSCLLGYPFYMRPKCLFGGPQMGEALPDLDRSGLGCVYPRPQMGLDPSRPLGRLVSNTTSRNPKQPSCIRSLAFNTEIIGIQDP
uniref:Uncharacterized protein n=1 Tax=Cannabis sativa TaxID=3483 RepID=A0A803QEI8_CANSA